MSDKCPFCGRGRDPGDPRGISYECGTLDNDPLPRAFQCMRDWACNLQAENEDLKETAWQMRRSINIRVIISKPGEVS